METAETYILQANSAGFNQYSVNPICKLCSKEPETREHFIGKCPLYDSLSEPYTRKLLANDGIGDPVKHQLQDPEFLTQTS